MSSGLSNLTLRVLTAAVLVPLVIVLLYFANWYWFAAAWSLALLLCGIELTSMFFRRHLWIASAAVCSAAIGFSFAISTSLFLRVVTTSFLLLVMLLVAFVEQAQSDQKHFGWLFAGPLYIGVCGGALLWISKEGSNWVVCLMTIAFVGDTAGYFIGKYFGSRPLHAKLSPKKTMEGALANAVGGIAAALAAHYSYLPQLSLVAALLLGSVGSVAGQIGDLFESFIKRTADVKDSGKLLPGHGGMLDRVDALLLLSAATYLMWPHLVL